MTPTRRDFLKASAAVAAGFTIVPPHVLGGPKHVAPSDKVNIALIGAGGQGRSNLHGLFKLPDAHLMAVADPATHWDLKDFYYKGFAGREPIRAEIDAHNEAKGHKGRCAEYEDFRTMLEKEKDIDAVLCATPDHLHAYVSLQSMRAGKHVYCEKPLTHNIAEARLVAAVAEETKVATQMGNQGHSTNGMRETVEWIQGGAIGPVRHVHAWVGTSRWNPTLQGRPAGSPVPSGLKWDLWLGPREARPFDRAYAPVAWRDFWAFGSSALGDFGCHDLDAATWALNLKDPLRIESSHAGAMDADIAPYGSLVTYHFGARGEMPPVVLHWYDGGLKPPIPDALPPETVLPGRGVMFIGDKGVVLCGGAGQPPKLLPAALDAGFVRPKPTLARSNGHHRDWLDAIKGGPAASSNFSYGARLTEITLLGVAAIRTGKTIDWDSAGIKARGIPEADAIFRESYRKGWELA
ncbi:Gfo/Idh/MocA family oxidoreductase [Singulisphaera sp. Ch08]|uniref:Gfo/Idh/MocA family oxidoreductase n=1 Tax=Singulisphaera sp. Ch08 TaxID=3120278 RepID=A0AAU7CHI3_9BACT